MVILEHLKNTWILAVIVLIAYVYLGKTNLQFINNEYDDLYHEKEFLERELKSKNRILAKVIEQQEANLVANFINEQFSDTNNKVYILFSSENDNEVKRNAIKIGKTLATQNQKIKYITDDVLFSEIIKAEVKQITAFDKSFHTPCIIKIKDNQPVFKIDLDGKESSKDLETLLKFMSNYLQ